MAFEGSYDDDFGVTHDTAYARVRSVYTNDDTAEIKIRIDLYASETAYQNGADPLEMVGHDYQDDPDSGDTPYADYSSTVASDLPGSTLREKIKAAAYQLITNRETRWDDWTQV